MRDDCETWIEFLLSPSAVARPFMDFEVTIKGEDVGLFADASRAVEGRGFGCYYRELGQWTLGTWEHKFIQECDPSIQFLELYALVVAIRLWGQNFSNRRIEINCDNESVVAMVNHSTSKCPFCMILIRMLTRYSMQTNVRVFAKHLGTKQNAVADALSRNNMNKFWKLVPRNTTKLTSEALPEDMWPIPREWFAKE